MSTEQIFKIIYQELKEELLKNKGKEFLKEYKIPSINYNSGNENLNDLYYTSGIEMELYRMMEQFEDKICFYSYKDKYFFSNNREMAQKRMLFEVENDSKKNYKNRESR